MTAAPDYSVDALVESVFRKTSSPNSQNLLLTNDVVQILDDELRAVIVPLIVSTREEYFVNYYDQAVSGASSYTIPQQAAGAMLRDVVFVDPNGNEINLQRFQPEQLKVNFTYGLPVPVYSFGYLLKDDQVILYPQQTQNLTQYTLRMKFVRRPNGLTLKAYCGQITNILAKAVTVGNVDTTWVDTDTFDIIQNYPQFNTVLSNQAVDSIAGNVLNFTDTPTGVVDGMWVCPHLMSCIPQIPYEAFPLLVQRGVVRVYESIGDSQGLQNANKTYDVMRADFIGMITPRVQGGTKKVVNKNNSFWRGASNAYVR